jgi:uncharacterized protein (DUF433 family)
MVEISIARPENIRLLPVNADPAVMTGKPEIAGTRITIELILEEPVPNCHRPGDLKSR